MFPFKFLNESDEHNFKEAYAAVQQNLNRVESNKKYLPDDIKTAYRFNFWQTCIHDSSKRGSFYLSRELRELVKLFVEMKK